MLQRQRRWINRCRSQHGHAKPDGGPCSNRARKIDVRPVPPRPEDRLDRLTVSIVDVGGSEADGRRPEREVDVSRSGDLCV
jgi:hypothetical protein